MMFHKRNFQPVLLHYFQSMLVCFIDLPMPAASLCGQLFLSPPMGAEHPGRQGNSVRSGVVRSDASSQLLLGPVMSIYDSPGASFWFLSLSEKALR